MNSKHPVVASDLLLKVNVSGYVTWYPICFMVAYWHERTLHVDVMGKTCVYRVVKYLTENLETGSLISQTYSIRKIQIRNKLCFTYRSNSQWSKFVWQITILFLYTTFLFCFTQNSTNGELNATFLSTGELVGFIKINRLYLLNTWKTIGYTYLRLFRFFVKFYSVYDT